MSFTWVVGDGNNEPQQAYLIDEERPCPRAHHPLKLQGNLTFLKPAQMPMSSAIRVHFIVAKILTTPFNDGWVSLAYYALLAKPT